MTLIPGGIGILRKGSKEGEECWLKEVLEAGRRGVGAFGTMVLEGGGTVADLLES